MEFKASDISQLVNGTIDGNPDVVVRSFAKIEEAKGGDITFLANPKYEHLIYSTNASAVLVSNTFEAREPISATLIRVEDPYSTLSMLMTMVDRLLNPQPTGVETPNYIAAGVEIPDGAYIGAFAYVGAGAKLGKDVKVYPQAYIGPGVEIGEGSIIYSGVKIYKGCRVGKNCVLHSGVVIGADGFGFAPQPDGTYTKIPQMGIVEIEDNVEVGANTTIDRATMGKTIVQSGTKLDNLIQVAHNVNIGKDNVLAAQVGVAGSTTIGNNCMIGGQVGFAGHIHVGDNVTIGAQSGIPNNVKAGSRLMGYPAVSAGDFARQAACMKRLVKLFDRVEDIEKILKSQK